MIEELKGLLEALSNTPDMALYGFGVFVAWKLIVYLSTAGSIVYVCKLVIERIAAYKKHELENNVTLTDMERQPREPEPPPPPAPPQEFTFGGRILGGQESVDELSNVLYSVARRKDSSNIAGNRYIHASDLRWLRDLVADAIEAEKKS